MSEEKRSKSLKDILVVGDWVIDEDWHVTLHRSKTSTEPIGTHYRSLAERNDQVIQICGAGRVARKIWQHFTSPYLPKSVQRPNNIIGLGLWAKTAEEEKDLRSLLCAPEKANDDSEDKNKQLVCNPYSLVRRFPDFNITNRPADRSSKPIHVSLKNLADFIQPPPDKTASYFCTTRTFRLFRTMEDDKLELVQRTDWETQFANFVDEVKECTYNQKLKSSSIIDNNQFNIGAIVVKCLAKGLVTKDLIAELANKHSRSHTDWFVSSKLGAEAPWLKSIPPGKLRLLLLPEIPISNLEQVPEWIVSKKVTPEDKYRLSHEAIEYLDKLTKDQNFVDKFASKGPAAIVANPQGLCLVCLFKDEEGEWQLIHHLEPDKYSYITGRIGKASVFFASLAARMYSEKPDSLADFIKHLRTSLNETLDWYKKEEERLGSRNHPQLTDVRPSDIVYGRTLGQCHNEWDESQTGLGIINENGELKLELWRGMSVIQNYVACTQKRRSEVARLYRISRAFIQNYPELISNSISCLLVDKPGSGKTSLIRGLAKSLGIRHLSFNITHMTRREDVIECFDQVASVQAQVRGKPILVFVDEIDADLSGTPVLDLFLSPLEDGIYSRQGIFFHLDPCIWLFAASNRAKNKEEGLKKLSDFRSRLSHGEANLSEDPSYIDDYLLGRDQRDQEDLQRLEQVYISASMMKQHFPGLKIINAGVLYHFYQMPPNSSSGRDIRHIIENIEDVQQDMITMRNMPKIIRDQYTETRLKGNELLRKELTGLLKLIKPTPESEREPFKKILSENDKNKRSEMLRKELTELRKLIKPTPESNIERLKYLNTIKDKDQLIYTEPPDEIIKNMEKLIETERLIQKIKNDELSIMEPLEIKFLIK